MTGPIELLEERLQEIRQMKDQDMTEIGRTKITHLYNEYYTCIEILKNGALIFGKRKRDLTTKLDPFSCKK